MNVLKNLNKVVDVQSSLLALKSLWNCHRNCDAWIMNRCICFLPRFSVKRSCRTWWGRLIQMSSWMRTLKRYVCGFSSGCKSSLSLYSFEGGKKASLKFVLCHESCFCPSKASTYCHIHHLDILFNWKSGGCMTSSVSSWRYESHCGLLPFFTAHKWCF